jgi:hypothetical protein
MGAIQTSLRMNGTLLTTRKPRPTTQFGHRRQEVGTSDRKRMQRQRVAVLSRHAKLANRQLEVGSCFCGPQEGICRRLRVQMSRNARKPPESTCKVTATPANRPQTPANHPGKSWKCLEVPGNQLCQHWECPNSRRTFGS